MAALPRVSPRQIQEALTRWRGNVQQAAEALGMHRDSLYDRINRLGLDVRTFRSAGLGEEDPPAPPPDLESPIRASPRRMPTVRLAPGHGERLREARLDFAARYRIETSETIILEQFFEEAFDAWLRGKLAGNR